MNTIKTHLPIYNGNYGTIWEDAPREEYEVKNINELRAEKNLKPIEFDDIEFDYETFYNELSELITNEVEFQLKDYVHSIKYLKLNSPRYYNYSNDYKSEEWELNTACKDYHKLGAILGFIAQNKDIEEYDIFDSVVGNICIYVLNYDTLLNN